jgi:mRNA interferase MazF
VFAEARRHAARIRRSDDEAEVLDWIDAQRGYDRLVVKRGDVVLAVASGDYGKPMTAVFVQTDILQGVIDSVVVCPLTSTLVDAAMIRPTVGPTPENGLKRRSQVMADKVVALRRDRIRDVVGRLDRTTMRALDRSLLFLIHLTP